MIEAQRVMAFVFDSLKADAGAGGVNTLLSGRIYRDLVPASALLPAATITLVSGTDSNTLGGDRVLETVLIDVRVIGDGASYGPLNPVADRIDAVLQNRGGVSGGVRTVELRRDQVQAFIETEASGKTYSHLLATYRTESHVYP